MNALYDVDPGDETQHNQGDLCEMCKNDLAKTGDDFCLACEAELDNLIERLRLARAIRRARREHGYA